MHTNDKRAVKEGISLRRGDIVDKLRRLAEGKPYVLLSPWTGSDLPAPVVASAWGLQLRASSADDPGVAAFVAMYAGGPQSPEPGASCSGALGSPR